MISLAQRYTRGLMCALIDTVPAAWTCVELPDKIEREGSAYVAEERFRVFRVLLV
jgi:hypothetical protein